MTSHRPQNSFGQILKDWSGVIALAPVFCTLCVFCVQLWQMPGRMDKFEKKQDLILHDLHIVADAQGVHLPNDNSPYGIDDSSKTNSSLTYAPRNHNFY